MRRRDFLAGAAAATAPRMGLAQERGRNYRVGFVIPSGRQSPPLVAFFDELHRHGLTEGQNLTVVPGGFETGEDRVPEQVAALVKAAPDAIITSGTATRLLQRATKTIPLLAMAEDMLLEGLVASLSRPGGNITGVSIMSPELDGKRQDLLIEAVPRARRIGALSDANRRRPLPIHELQNAAQARGVDLTIIPVARTQETARAIDNAKASGIEALNVLATPLFGSFPNRRLVFERIAAARLPAIYQWPDMADDGGLIAYGPSFSDLYRQRARMLVKVLRGTKPADIPVEQPTRFELVINLKTAKAIGHEIPAGLVLRADRLVE